MGIQTSSINSGPVSGFKNKVINGDFRVAQRGASGSSNGATYMLDRFSLEPRLSTTCSWAQSTDIPSGQPFAYSMRVSATNATDDGFHIRTGVELPATGVYTNWVPGSNWTVSFWIKSAYSGRTVQPALLLSSSQTNATSFSQTAFPSSGAVAIPTTWTRLSFNYTLPTWAADAGSLTNVTCFLLRILIGVDNTPQDVYITGIQLEEGTVATDFEERPIGTELALCQRYFQTWGGGITWAAGSTVAVGGANEYFRSYGATLPVVMRAAPSVTFASNNSTSGGTTGYMAGTVGHQGPGAAGDAQGGSGSTSIPSVNTAPGSVGRISIGIYNTITWAGTTPPKGYTYGCLNDFMWLSSEL